MPYFSFSIKENLNSYNNFNIEPNRIYFSKNTDLWKELHNKKNIKKAFFLKFEHRKKIKNLRKKILFCLPPNIGLGDAIEYALAIKSISVKKIFLKIGVAFAGKHSFILRNYFDIKEIYEDAISLDEMNQYDNIFHFTLEIKSLEMQKNIRANIIRDICDYFKVDCVDLNNSISNKNKIKKISIFPISKSPIRTMPISLINKLIIELKNYFELEIYFNKENEISNYIKNNITTEDYKIVDPPDAVSLIELMKNIDYGIFVDSGPLHLAKIFGKKGMLIETSVSKDILIDTYKNLKCVNNTYKSSYCEAPCGLTDIFNYNKKVGCYDSILVSKKEIIELSKIRTLNRRNIKNSFLFYLSNPVGCVRELNINKIIKEIKEDLKI